MPGEEFLRFRHPVDGEIVWVIDGRHICIEARWPIDLATSEWSRFSDRFPLGDYREAVEALLDTGTCRLEGEGLGIVEFHVRDSGGVAMEATDYGGADTGRFIVALSLSPSDFRVPVDRPQRSQSVG